MAVVLTIRDIAQRAGVSAATVSRALRGLDNVDARTRERIVEIARELNYSVSPAASRLATGRSETVGIVTPYVGRWYFTELFAGIEAALKPYNLDLLLHTTAEPIDGIGVADAHLRLRRRVDGAVVVGLAPEGREIEGLSRLDVPIVLIGSQAPGLASVSIDDRAGARTAVAHLADAGHERIGLISGRRLPTGFVPENDRLTGYLEALRERGLPSDESLRAIGDFTTAGGERAMGELLRRGRPPSAVFCMSDEMAYGAVRALRRAGMRAGGDRDAGEIALVGFDDHDLAEVFDITTVAQPVRRLGALAVELLIDQLENGSAPRVIVVPTELRVRASSQMRVTNA